MTSANRQIESTNITSNREIDSTHKTVNIQWLQEIDKSTSQLQVFANKVTSMTIKNTEEHKAWTGKVRAAVYGTNGAVSVGLIFADIFGCFILIST